MKQENDWFSKIVSFQGIVYGLASILFITVLYPLLQENLAIESRYIVWLLTLNLITFFMYGLDKMNSKSVTSARIPEPILHLLGLLGGFIAGWFWVLFFHKKNWGKHPYFPILLTVALIIHGWLIYLQFFQR